MARLRPLHLAIAAAAVGVVLLSSHPRDLWEAIRGVDGALVAAAVALNVPVLLLAPLRSHLVFQALGHNVPPRLLAPATVLGFVAGGLTPVAAGELLRAGPLRAAGVPYEHSVAAVAYERMLGLYLLGLSTSVVFALGELEGPWGWAALAGAAPFTLLPAFTASALPALSPEQANVPGPRPVQVALRAVLSLAEQSRLLVRDKRLLAPWAAVTLAMFAVITLQYWLLARAVADGVTFREAWLALGVSTLAGVASLIPLGLGVLDGSMAAVLSRLGMTLEEGGVVALLVRATVTLPLVIAAFACYTYLQRYHVPPAHPQAGAGD